MTPSTLGSYELQEELGRGGMGIVYRALQPSLGRRVAIKVLLPHLSEDAEFVERFLREARAAARLEHPGIVTIHDVDEVDGTYFFSMQLLEGNNLETMIEESGGLPLETAADLALQLGEALGYAHRAGIVHRDVKPANVIVEEDGRAILTDFGIAWASSDTRLTRTGSSIGSPDYMSPEQITGRDVDQRSDLYSLGVVFFQMLTGRLPFSGSTPLALAYQHVNESVPSVRQENPAVPQELDTIVQRLMAKPPDERYADAESFLTDLADQFPELAAARRRRFPSGSSTAAGAAETASSSAAARGLRERRTISAVGLALSIVGLIVLALAFTYFQNREDTERGGSRGALTPGADPVEAVPIGTSAPEGVLGEVDSAESRVVDEPGPGPAEVGEEAPLRTAESRELLITSQPEGAEVSLDGVVQEGSTPLAISIVGDERHQVALRLAGHDPAGWTFSWQELSDEQRASGELHFPLTSSVPPGTLQIRSAYAASVRVNGKRHQVGPGATELPLPPGSYRVGIEAQEVFHSSEQTVMITSESTYDLALPPVYSVRVFAVPGNCRLRVDGRYVDDLPIESLRLAAGMHEFEFRWEVLGETRVVTERIGPGTRQISAAASR